MLKANYNIKLTDLRFHAYHGVMPQETKVGNEFIVSVFVTIPFQSSVLDDNLDATISYADIYDIVKDEMNHPRKLLETVAATISIRLTEKWKQIVGGEVKICKSTPPISGISGSSEVAIIF